MTADMETGADDLRRLGATPPILITPFSSEELHRRLRGDQTEAPSFFEYNAVVFAASYDTVNEIEDSIWIENLEEIHRDGACKMICAAERRFWKCLAEGVDRTKTIYVALHEKEDS